MVLLPRVGRPWNTPDRRDPRSFLDLEILSSPGHCWIQVRKILTVSPFDLTRDGFKWYEFMNGYGGKLRVFVFSSRDVSRYCLNYDRFKGFVLGWVYKNFHFYIAFRFLSKISKGIIYLSRGYQRIEMCANLKIYIHIYPIYIIQFSSSDWKIDIRTKRSRSLLDYVRSIVPPIGPTIHALEFLWRVERKKKERKKEEEKEGKENERRGEGGGRSRFC